MIIFILLVMIELYCNEDNKIANWIIIIKCTDSKNKTPMPVHLASSIILTPASITQSFNSKHKSQILCIVMVVIKWTNIIVVSVSILCIVIYFRIASSLYSQSHILYLRRINCINVRNIQAMVLISKLVFLFTTYLVIRSVITQKLSKYLCYNHH